MTDAIPSETSPGNDSRPSAMPTTAPHQRIRATGLISKPTNTTKLEATGLRARRSPRQGTGPVQRHPMPGCRLPGLRLVPAGGLRSGGTGSPDDRRQRGLPVQQVTGPRRAVRPADGRPPRRGVGLPGHQRLLQRVEPGDRRRRHRRRLKVSGTPMARKQDLPGYFEASPPAAPRPVVMTGAGYAADAHIGKGQHRGQPPGYMRQITDNDTTTLTSARLFRWRWYRARSSGSKPNFTTGIAFPTVDLVPSHGARSTCTRMKTTDIGETQIRGPGDQRQHDGQPRATDASGSSNTRSRRGRSSLNELLVTGQLHLELDRRDEYLAFRAQRGAGLRILSPQRARSSKPSSAVPRLPQHRARLPGHALHRPGENGSGATTRPRC